MWSGWKCEIRTVSIAAGAIPAAARLLIMKPAVSAIWPAVPASIRMSFDPVLTSSTVNDTGRMFGGRNAAASAPLTAEPEALRTNSSSIFSDHRPS